MIEQFGLGTGGARFDSISCRAAPFQGSKVRWWREASENWGKPAGHKKALFDSRTQDRARANQVLS